MEKTRTLVEVPIRLELCAAPENRLLRTERYLVTLPFKQPWLKKVSALQQQSSSSYDDLLARLIWTLVETHTTLVDDLFAHFPDQEEETEVTLHLDGTARVLRKQIHAPHETDVVIHPFASRAL